MKLQQLFYNYQLQNCTESDELFNSDIEGLFFEAQKVIPQSIFVAVKGTNKDGHDFIPQAIEQGAVALVVNDLNKVPKSFKGLISLVEDTRTELDSLATHFFENPSLKMLCFGVTGTNGKTSITYILEHILKESNFTVGVMGTINHRVDDQVWTSQMTTPDPVTLQSRLADFYKAGAKAALMEISSHALDQKRARSVNFNTVLFTNLTQDHLDYHKDMQTYFEAKQKLFTDMMWSSLKRPLFAIVNIDDKYGRRLKVAEPVIVWTYGENKEADFNFKITQMDFKGTEFKLKTPVDTMTVKMHITGKYNVYNGVAAMAAALSFGVPIEKSIKALESFKGIPGRLELVTGFRQPVYVDYAHTPDALENTLKTLMQIKQETKYQGRIICVFGCGGDRDKQKRPLMASVACKWADQVVVTSDNPRMEDPKIIIQDVIKGFPVDFKSYQVEIDREKAIQWAIQNSDIEDVILIAGKGHEDYQVVGTEKKHFSDVEVVQKYLR